jgi:hypothetical protein
LLGGLYDHVQMVVDIKKTTRHLLSILVCMFYSMYHTMIIIDNIKVSNIIFVWKKKGDKVRLKLRPAFFIQFAGHDLIFYFQSDTCCKTCIQGLTINVLLFFLYHNLVGTTASMLHHLVVGCGISGGEFHTIHLIYSCMKISHLLIPIFGASA